MLIHDGDLSPRLSSDFGSLVNRFYWHYRPHDQDKNKYLLEMLAWRLGE